MVFARRLNQIYCGVAIRRWLSLALRLEGDAFPPSPPALRPLFCRDWRHMAIGWAILKWTILSALSENVRKLKSAFPTGSVSNSDMCHVSTMWSSVNQPSQLCHENLFGMNPTNSVCVPFPDDPEFLWIRGVIFLHEDRKWAGAIWLNVSRSHDLVRRRASELQCLAYVCIISSIPLHTRSNYASECLDAISGFLFSPLTIFLVSALKIANGIPYDLT